MKIIKLKMQIRKPENMNKQDFLTLQEFSDKEIWDILKTAKKIKLKKGDYNILKGKSFALLFQKPSTRTRVSFDVAINQLGGHSIYLGWAESQLGRGETLADTARVLSRYLDCIIARVNNHSDLEEIANYAEIPVINALSNLYHPCQTIADLYTIWEKFETLDNLKVAYVGDGNNVCNSLLIGCSKLGINISVACPIGYEPHSTAQEKAKMNAKKSGSKIEVLREPIDAVRNADVVYTDTFVSMGDEPEKEKRLKTFLPKYQVTSELFKYASENALFMHCLPAHRGEEVTDEVMDGPLSIIWDQAENRLHTAKAILTKIVA
ncbi:MAG: ornithine carbamoyltransferase [Candidatus Bathyarchaeia archaeon]